MIYKDTPTNDPETNTQGFNYHSVFTSLTKDWNWPDGLVLINIIILSLLQFVPGGIGPNTAWVDWHIHGPVDY